MGLSEHCEGVSTGEEDSIGQGVERKLVTTVENKECINRIRFV